MSFLLHGEGHNARHAIVLGWLQHDPSLGVKRPKGGEVRSWTDAELAQFDDVEALVARDHVLFREAEYDAVRLRKPSMESRTERENSSVRR